MNSVANYAHNAAIAALGAIAVYEPDDSGLVIHSHETIAQWIGAVTRCGTPYPTIPKITEAVDTYYKIRTDQRRMIPRDLVAIIDRDRRINPNQPRTYPTNEPPPEPAGTTRAGSCPTCNATPGQPCINAATGRAYSPRVPGHPARWAITHEGTSA